MGTADTGKGGATAPETNDGFTAITSQEQLDQVLAKRLERERSKFADYDALKAKASKLDDLEQSNKTETQKLEERVSAAEKSAQAAQIEALRFRVASKHGVSDEDADLFLTGTDEATLVKQAERLAAHPSQKTPVAPSVPREGIAAGKPEEGEMREFTRQLFGNED